MKIDFNNLEDTLFGFIDQIRVLIEPEIWSNILMDCSKNELLVLLLLYRSSDVNMTQIAEYLNVPLNTATGIVGRMEKRGIVLRVRSVEDKRVVTINLTDLGKQQLQIILRTFMGYGRQVIESLTAEEIALLSKVINKVIAFLQEVRTKDEAPSNKVRKIVIE